jgi:hypothetical protein
MLRMIGEPHRFKLEWANEDLVGGKAGEKKPRLQIFERGDTTVLDMGTIEIWDGADLALQRATLMQLRDVGKCRSVGIEMRNVKHVPSGFFGMLYDWRESHSDYSVRVYSPQPHVRQMIWFQEFFEQEIDGSYILLREPKQDFMHRESDESECDTEADLFPQLPRLESQTLCR